MLETSRGYQTKIILLAFGFIAHDNNHHTHHSYQYPHCHCHQYHSLLYWVLLFSSGTCTILKTHHVYFTLKRRENDIFHVVSTWNTRGLLVLPASPIVITKKSKSVWQESLYRTFVKNEERTWWKTLHTTWSFLSWV